MRTVITGKPGALYPLQASDLPPDFDLRQSFWQYADFSGFDLSAYDMRDMDVRHCRATGVILPAKLDWLVSRRTDWTGAVLPAEMPSYNHDLMREFLRQRSTAVRGRARTIATMVATRIAGADYLHSWVDTVQAVITGTGLTPAQVKAAAKALFAPQPRLVSRLSRTIDSGIYRPVVTYPGWGRVPVDGVEMDFLQDAALTADRYLLSQGLRWRLWDMYRRDYLVHVDQIDPYPILSIIRAASLDDGSKRFGWWRRGYSL